MINQLKLFAIVIVAIISFIAFFSCEAVDDIENKYQMNKELPENIVEIVSDPTYQRYIIEKNELKSAVDRLTQDQSNILYQEYDAYLSGQDVDEEKLELIYDSISDVSNINLTEKIECFIGNLQYLEDTYGLIHLEKTQRQLLTKSTICFFEQNNQSYNNLFKSEKDDLLSLLKSADVVDASWEDPYEAEECIACEHEAYFSYERCEGIFGTCQAGAMLVGASNPAAGMLLAIICFSKLEDCIEDVTEDLDDCKDNAGCP